MNKRQILTGLLLSLAIQSPPLLARPPYAGESIQVAQTFEAEKGFFLEVLTLADKGQDTKELILKKKELARQTFRLILKNYPNLTAADEKQVASLFLNMVARTFEGAGEPQLTKTLKTQKLWVAASTVPKKEPVASNEAAEGNDFEILSGVAIRFGNFMAGRRMSEAALAIIEMARKQKPDPKLDLGLLLSRFLSAAQQAFGGQPAAAIANITPLIEPMLAIHDQDFDFGVYGILVYAGRQAARPDVVDRYLPPMRNLARRVKNHKGSLYRFLAESWAFEREMQKNPGISAKDFVARDQLIWKELEGYTTEGDTQAEGRLFGDALKFWIRGLSVYLKDPALDAPTRSSVEAKIVANTRKAQVLAEESLKNRSPLELNPEFSFSLMESLLDLLDSKRDRGEVREARKLLEEFSVYIRQFEKQFKEVDGQWVKEIGKEIDSRKPKLEELRKAGLDFDLDSFKFSLLEGDVSRLLVRYHKAWQRQLQAEGATAGPELELHIAEAEKYQQLQSRGQGYQGLDDAGWDRIAYLAKTRPAQWTQSAAPLIDEALKINTKLEYRPGQIQALTYDGEVKAADGKTPEAILSLQKAVDLIESYVADVGGGAAAARKVREQYQHAYDLLAQLQIAQGKGEEAFGTLARLQQVRSMVTASTDSNDKAKPKAVESVAALRSQSGSLQQEMMRRKANNVDTKPIEELLADNKAQFHTALNQLRQQNPRYESLLAVRPINFSKQQKFIPKDTAIVQYFPAEDSLYIFVVTNTDLKIRRVQVTQADLYAEVTTYRKIAVNSILRAARNGEVPAIHWIDDGTPSYQQLVAPLAASSMKLHRWLIDPVEPDIADKEIIAFIPTGMLDYLPMQALGRHHPQKGLEFLIERKQCVTLLKSSDIDQLSHPHTPGEGGMLALGNPDGSLPGAEQEVNSIVQSFASSQKYLGADAKKERISALSPGIAYLHLATHGSLDSHDPNASFLVMAGTAEQAKLRVPQIYDLKLEGVRLVTLSACETALGEQDPGSELSSLADAFGVAGSNSVLASLWRVSDSSTYDLMVGFYRRVKEGQSLSKSLQGAEVAMLANPKTAHPYFWAPFNLIGDWR